MAASTTHAEAQARYRAGDLIAAKALFESALADDPQHWASRHDLGFLLRQLGDRAGADHHVRASIALSPDRAVGWTTAGLLNGDAGSFRQARRSIDRARLIAPAEPTSLIARADLASDDECAGFAGELAATLRRPDLPVRLRARVLHALGRLLDRLGDAEQALASISAAHALRRQSEPYDAAEDSEFFASIQNACDSQWWKRPGNTAGSDARPIFIVGMPRSGTTMVEQMLSRHPAVAAGGESLALQTVLFGELPNRMQRPFPDCLAYAEPADYAWVAERYLERTAERRAGSSVLTDKLPANFLLVGPILKAFPDARILSLSRDPLDTCVSCYLTDFAHGQSYATDLGNLGQHYRLFQSLMDHWRGFGDRRLLPVDFESVVTDPEASLRRILAHCRLDWHPDCLAFERASHPVNTAAWQRVRGPLDDARIGRWRRFDRRIGRLVGALTSPDGTPDDRARRALVWEPELAAESVTVVNGASRRTDAERWLARLPAVLAREPGQAMRAAALAEQIGASRVARELWRTAAAAAPSVAAIHINRAVAHGRLGETSAAVVALRRALSLAPESPEAASNLGNFLAASDLPAASVQHRRATLIDPVDAGLHVNLGMTLMRSAAGLAATERAMRRALVLNPSNRPADLSLYHLNSADGPSGTAVRRLDRLLRVHPIDGEMHYERGCALRDLDRDAEAVDSLRRAIVLAPQITAWRHVLDSLTGHVSRTAPVDYVRELFDQYADRFDVHLTEGLRYRTPVALCEALGRADRSRQRFARVLDLGCGTGLMGASLRERFSLGHLTGVDVSGAMLAKLAEKGGYDATAEADIEGYLERSEPGYDLIVAADVLVYFGALDRVLAGVRRALAPDGVLAISVEESTGTAPFELKRHGRYAHRRAYIESAAAAVGLRTELAETAELRDEGRKPVVGLLMVLTVDRVAAA